MAAIKGQQGGRGRPGTSTAGLLPPGNELVPDSGHFVVFLGPLSGLPRRVGEICCFPAPRAPQDLRASITPFRPSQGLKGLEKDLFPCCLSHKALFFSLPEPSRVRLWRVSRPRVRAPAGEEGARGGRAPGLRAAGRARTPGGLGWGVELAKAEL